MPVVTVGPLRLPRAFYDDHISRDLPAPDPVRETARFVWVRADDPWLPELYSDAAHYEDFDTGNDPETNAENRRYASAARRLLAVLRKAGWTAEEARARYPHAAMEEWDSRRAP